MSSNIVEQEKLESLEFVPDKPELLQFKVGYDEWIWVRPTDVVLIRKTNDGLYLRLDTYPEPIKLYYDEKVESFIDHFNVLNAAPEPEKAEVANV